MLCVSRGKRDIADRKLEENPSGDKVRTSHENAK